MDIENKVSLTISLPGSVMMSKDECLKTTQKIIKNKNLKTGKIYDKVIDIEVDDFDKNDKHTLLVKNRKTKNSEVITFYTRKCIPAKQSLNITKESYNYMVSNECPEWHKKGEWNKMNKTQRLESHLNRIAESLGGKMLSYQVFDD